MITRKTVVFPIRDVCVMNLIQCPTLLSPWVFFFNRLGSSYFNTHQTWNKPSPLILQMFLLYRTIASKDMILLVETGQRSRLVTAKVDHFPWLSTTICVSVSIHDPPLGPLSVITQNCQIILPFCLWHCYDIRGSVCWGSHVFQDYLFLTLVT